MSDGLTFTPLRPSDLFEIQRCEAQLMVLGMAADISDEEALILCAGPLAYACRNNGRLYACFGVAEQFAGTQGLGWALLADEIGAAHLPFTRFVRAELAKLTLRRIEVLTRAPDIEPILHHLHDYDPGQIVDLARANATPEMRWAELLGFRAGHLLRCFGAACETYMLFEMLRPQRGVA